MDRTYTYKTLRHAKSQSAMEYLMTYGWAILIIAVVLGVLFQLGVFSGSALTPKAAPGACQVVRLGGQVSLEGECQGQLPEYTGQFSNGFLKTSDAGYPSGTSAEISMFAWINPASSCAGTNFEAFQGYGSTSQFGNAIYIALSNCELGAQLFGLQNIGPASFDVQPGAWSFVGYTLSGATMTFYLNNKISSPSTFSTTPNIQTGGGYNYLSYFPLQNYFDGGMSNIQIYNTTLSSNEVEALYQEGIGGAPIRPQNLVGWWPINGNAQDYSGNNNNGQISGGVSFNGTWQAGYTPP